MADTRTTYPEDLLTVSIAQIKPAWLNREQTLDKMMQFVQQAAEQGSRLVAFGETTLPGYPFWLSFTDGARFDSQVQKDIFAHYMKQSVCIEEGDLDPMCELARQLNISVMMGIAERPADRGSHSIYCSLVYIDAAGQIESVHRKLMPTYEERLCWGPGDGNGLRVHDMKPFTLGGLNCWENWMPLPRAAMYAMGEDLHVAAWPGSVSLTRDITRFVAREGRSYVLSASTVLTKQDLPDDIPHADLIKQNAPDVLANGGSCIATPDGQWLVEPLADEEALITATIDHQNVRAERQNFDPSGHYSRPDVLQVMMNRERQGTLIIEGEDPQGISYPM